jgi:hypothetical protein
MTPMKETEKLYQQKAQQAQFLEMQNRARKDFLGKIASSVAATLDFLCPNDHDRVSILSSLLAYMTVRSGGSEAEVQKMMGDAYREQKEAQERAQLEAKAKDSNLVIAKP